MEKRPALGKGLSALIPDAPDTFATPRASLDVDIDQLEPNDYQPRAHDGRCAARRSRPLDPGQRHHSADRRAQLERIAGARDAIRSSPASAAGAQRSARHSRKVPVVVKDVADGDRRRQLEMALIENIQREDLNPIEAAGAYQRLVDEFALTQDDIAAQVGKDRATVANYLRLLKLPEEVRANVASGALSMGHARAIVALTAESDQRRLARDVVARGLSVRETEALVKKEIGDKRPAPTAVADANRRKTCTRARPKSSCGFARHAGRDQAERQGRKDRNRLYNENELQRFTSI